MGIRRGRYRPRRGRHRPRPPRPPLARRARSISLAVIGAAAVCGILTLVLGSDGGRQQAIVIHGYYLRFPVFQIALFVSLATAALPYLARTVQRVVELLIGIVSLAAAVGGHGLPVNVLGSMAIGWGVVAALHLAFGSPLGLPSASDVSALLAELGIAATDMRPLPRQVWGVAKYGATETSGPGAARGRLGVSVYGRDAANAKLLAKTGRFLFYRDSGPGLTLTRLQQVEHEAYLNMRAAQAGVAVAELLDAGAAGASGDALLVYRMPVGNPLSEAEAAEVSDTVIDDIFAQMLLLRRARIAHGAISGDTVLVDPENGSSALLDFRNASSRATPDQLSSDMAGAIAAVALAVGPTRAGDAAARSLDTEQLAGALRHLRRAGLDPVLAHALRPARNLLEEVRQRAASSKQIELPALTEPRRVSWPTLIMLVGSLIGGWALIGVLIDVSQSFDTIVGANWAWVVLALVLTQLAYVASALEAIGSVTGTLPFGRVLGVEVANCFSALAGGMPAVVALRGCGSSSSRATSLAVAVSSGAIMTSSTLVATIAAFLISLPFAWSTIHLEVTPESGGHSKLVWVLLAIVVLVAIVFGLAVALPKLRRATADRLRPQIRSIWGNLKQVAKSPGNLILLLGGSFGNELFVAMALSVSLRAFDEYLSLPTLIVVITLASIVGGISPSPGGMGVVEAGMILGLTAAGVSEADATAAVFVQRLFSSYLPPIWGWFTLVWMRKREYL